VHVSPVQHASRSPPEAGEGEHMPLTQVSVPKHASPAQQGEPSPPQVPHVPLTQSNVPVHVSPVQQGCWSLPH
jgi:hypothetical protein